MVIQQENARAVWWPVKTVFFPLIYHTDPQMDIEVDE